MSIYRRGKYWWISYSARGRRIFESSKSTKREVAEELFKKRNAARETAEARKRERVAANRPLEAIGWSDYDAMTLLISSVNAAVNQLRHAHLAIAGVYFIQAGQFVKIGYSTDLDNRIRELQVGNPHDLKLLAILPGTSALEQRMHRLLVDERERGEWYRLDGVLAAFLRQLAIHEPPQHFATSATTTERKERKWG